MQDELIQTFTHDTLELDVPPNIPEGFHVQDSNTANWVVRKVLEARAYRQHVAEWADREKRRSEQEEKFFIFRYGRQLEDWLATALQATASRRRSIHLPAGTIGFRRTRQSIILVDEDKVLAWARGACPSVIVVSEHVSKSAIGEHLDNTGEVPEGVRVDPPADRFYIS